MAIVTTDSKHYSNIAAAIREKTGDETTYTPEEIPAGIDEVYEAGKQEGVQSEYDRFWDSYQNNGNRQEYQYAFGGPCWNDETFNPKYDFNITGNCGQMFSATNITDLCGKTIWRGLKFTMSNLTYAASMFAYANKITHIPAISLVGLKSANGLFNFCVALVTIDELAIDESYAFIGDFDYCDNLENLTIKGTIGKNGLKVSWSTKLTHDSLMSIINALKDYSADTSGTTWAVTLGTENLAKLTDTEKAIATQKGWTLA